LKRVDHDQSLNFKHIAELEKPDKFKNPVTNVAACRARDEPIFYVLFSNEDFSFVRKYRLEDEIHFTEEKTSGFITAKNSLEIKVLELDKLAISTHNEIIIYNFEKNTIDFRIKFAKYENFETTAC
jgi:hypothetical protein